MSETLENTARLSTSSLAFRVRNKTEMLNTRNVGYWGFLEKSGFTDKRQAGLEMRVMTVWSI